MAAQTLVANEHAKGKQVGLSNTLQYTRRSPCQGNSRRTAPGGRYVIEVSLRAVLRVRPPERSWGFGWSLHGCSAGVVASQVLSGKDQRPRITSHTTPKNIGMHRQCRIFLVARSGCRRWLWLLLRAVPAEHWSWRGYCSWWAGVLQQLSCPLPPLLYLLPFSGSFPTID